jgi:heparan-alpha-glucosaminide N-acetyltransferase
MMLMIFVNYGGGNYVAFNHSVWDGLTYADLVFPFFMWIMGVSMAFSLKSTFQSKKGFLGRVIPRCLWMVLLGFVTNNSFLWT